MLRLYHHPFSTFARRVRIALLEKNIEHEAITVDLPNRAHKAPEYLALN
ncbi:MAG: glutathione S-transferase family protein, partial [Steroidobacteraceae bacterium]